MIVIVAIIALVFGVFGGLVYAKIKEHVKDLPRGSIVTMHHDITVDMNRPVFDVLGQEWFIRHTAHFAGQGAEYSEVHVLYRGNVLLIDRHLDPDMFETNLFESKMKLHNEIKCVTSAIVELFFREYTIGLEEIRNHGNDPISTDISKINTLMKNYSFKEVCEFYEICGQAMWAAVERITAFILLDYDKEMPIYKHIKYLMGE